MRVSFCVLSNNYNRLDKFISQTLNLSRRRIKFLFSENRIYINRRLAKKSEKPEKGDLIEVEFIDENFDYRNSNLKIVKETKDYLIIYKPARFHSQELFKSKFSVENFLKSIYGENVKLLNRLDYYSQGFLIASKTEDFYKKFKQEEEDKKIEKYYLTFVEGRFLSKIKIANSIDYKRRKIVKVLDKISDKIITEVFPVGIYSTFSIVCAKIYKGARHQIRAHLSYKSHPLIGDTVYGSKINIDMFLFCFGYYSKELNLNFFDFSLLKEEARKYLKILLNFDIF